MNGNFRMENSMEDYRTYAELLNRIDYLHFKLFEEMSGDVPKTIINSHWQKMYTGETELRSGLEDRMAKEHPDEWTTDVFYGGDDE